FSRKHNVFFYGAFFFLRGGGWLGRARIGGSGAKIGGRRFAADRQKWRISRQIGVLWLFRYSFIVVPLLFS
ncbi:MAG: hypothetical protein LBJ64_06105, partial [Deltaproteobacteria bacterium]|nr:hypothetical protein [Deltaproteobacteria bacterium]